MTDYGLSKLFFELQRPAAAAEYRTDRAAVIARYDLTAEVTAALMADDVAAVAPLVNPYLLRFYFVGIGMPDDEFIRALRKSVAPKEESNG